MPAADEVTTLPIRPLPRVLITIATYNEIENLPALTASIWEFLPTVDILVIDDHSPDGTGRWVQETAEREPRLKLLSRPGKMGLGSAIVAGVKYAAAHDYEFVLNMDADFSHHPRYLPSMVAGMDEADVMIGSRYVPGGGVRDWPWLRRMMSRGVNLYARCLLSLSAQDCSGAFRCYRTSVIRRVDLDHLRSRGYSFQEEILWELKRVGARFAETPILFTDREKGLSKINGREALAAIWIIFRLGVTNWTGV